MCWKDSIGHVSVRWAAAKLERHYLFLSLTVWTMWLDVTLSLIHLKYNHMDSAMHLSWLLQQWYPVYMWSLYKDGSLKVSLVASKTCHCNKEADHTTLELLGAVILSQLMHNVTAFLPTPVSTFYCMDFMATLYWIRTVKARKQYVAHSATEICQLTKQEEWQH